ncbi:MAG: hypothetical protein JSW47_06265 [Phycisphaerales bacterium]|nr:MAG: hypothetical protein JSW47_06265 [Phycisphaerales bacterium]
MKESQENLANQIGGWLCLLGFPVISGIVVALGLYFDGMGYSNEIGSKSPLVLLSWIIASCILWALPFIIQKIRKKGEVHIDERGVKIFKNAALTAATISMLYFLTVCFVAVRAVGPNGSVSVNIIPAIFVGWIVVFQIALFFCNLCFDKFGRRNGR